MKGEHYEDFTMVLQYFNLKDIAVQKALQIYRKTGEALLQVDVKDVWLIFFLKTLFFLTTSGG